MIKVYEKYTIRFLKNYYYKLNSKFIRNWLHISLLMLLTLRIFILSRTM